MRCVPELSAKYEYYRNIFLKKFHESPKIPYSIREIRKFLIAALVLEGLKPSEIPRVRLGIDTITVSDGKSYRVIEVMNKYIYRLATSAFQKMSRLEELLKVTDRNIRYICRQVFGVSCREVRRSLIFYLVCNGRYEELKTRLGISPSDVEYHYYQWFRKRKKDNIIYSNSSAYESNNNIFLNLREYGKLETSGDEPNDNYMLC